MLVGAGLTLDVEELGVRFEELEGGVCVTDAGIADGLIGITFEERIS
jgi:hypothetical protein